MMIDLNDLRDEFSRYLNDKQGQRHSMDGALMHVCRIAYEHGLKDGHQAAVDGKDAGQLVFAGT